MERLEEDDFVGETFCGVLLLDRRLDREAEGWTNAKPCAKGAERQRSVATDFIMMTW